MRCLFSAIVSLAWACWFGGSITLFAVLGRIFTTPGFARDEQGAFAARLFPMFERMQLVFAAVTLLGTTIWWFVARTKLKLALFALFGLATVAAVVEASVITPRVESLVADGRRGTPEFDRMHRISTRVYMSGAVVLLVAGILLPSAIRGDVAINPPSPRTSEETAQA
jgi:hypothetical protein